MKNIAVFLSILAIFPAFSLRSHAEGDVQAEGYHVAKPATPGCLKNDTATGQKFDEIDTTSGYDEKPDSVNRDELTNVVHLVYPSGTIDITLDESSTVTKVSCSFMRSSP